MGGNDCASHYDKDCNQIFLHRYATDITGSFHKDRDRHRGRFWRSLVRNSSGGRGISTVPLISIALPRLLGRFVGGLRNIIFTMYFQCSGPGTLRNGGTLQALVSRPRSGIGVPSQCGCEGQVVHPRAWPFRYRGKRYGWSCALSRNSNGKSSAVAVRFVIWL